MLDDRLDLLMRMYVENDISSNYLYNEQLLGKILGKFAEKNRIQDFGYIE